MFALPLDTERAQAEMQDCAQVRQQRDNRHKHKHATRVELVLRPTRKMVNLTVKDMVRFEMAKCTYLLLLACGFHLEGNVQLSLHVKTLEYLAKSAAAYATNHSPSFLDDMAR